MSRTKKEEEDEVYKEPQEIIIHPMKSMTSPKWERYSDYVHELTEEFKALLVLLQWEYLVDDEGKSLVVRIPWHHHSGIIQHRVALTLEEAQRMKDAVETSIKEKNI